MRFMKQMFFCYISKIHEHSTSSIGFDEIVFSSRSPICHILGIGELEIHAFSKNFRSCIKATTGDIFSKLLGI